MTSTYNPDLVPWTPAPAPRPTRHDPDNAIAHLRAQLERLSTANAQQAHDNIALTATIREVHAILSERSSERTDRQKIELAGQHLVRTLARIGAFLVKDSVYRRAW